ncbi:MAG: FapA family protein [Deferribacteraceae bacterium]|jgi:uncharacterized protein (DUF342 family)|nr:FapA family protein [Deferribacteraceae bacterium]
MVLKIIGASDTAKVSALCINTYHCGQDEFSIGGDFAGNPSVAIKHDRPIDGDMLLTVSSDNMSASAIFFPPINGGKMPSANELISSSFSSLEGIRREFLVQSAFERGYNAAASGVIVYGVVVAVGKQPEHGINGTVQLFFEKPSKNPVVEEGGKAFFKELRTYVNVRKDQLLARIIPPKLGKAGATVTGTPIPQIEGKPVEFSAGEGVRTGGNGNEFFALYDGHVIFKSGVLSVFDSITVNGDVDFSTGNISFTGTVLIKGNVLGGFTVKGKDINIDGICYDATLVAENDIFIKTGVKSRNKYFINAGGNIEVTYCENARLTARKSIFIKKYAFNSILNAGESVEAQDRSTITGGEIHTFSGGNFYNLGTKANTAITVTLGKKYNLDEKLVRIKAERERLNKSLEKIEKVLAGIDLFDDSVIKNPKIAKLMEMQSLISKRVELFTRRVESVTRESIYSHPSISIQNEIQSGVKLIFYAQELIIRETQKKVVYSFNSDTLEIECKPIS